MTAEYIYKFALACAQVYGTRDPESIFRQRTALIKKRAPDGLRGMICASGGRVVVAVDAELPESIVRVTLAHLLGHAVLHRKRIMSGKVYEESENSSQGAAEREADVFAAELLITDDEIISLRDGGMSEGQIVSSFGTMRETVLHKLFSMRSRGIVFDEGVCRADFLKKCDIELFF